MTCRRAGLGLAELLIAVVLLAVLSIVLYSSEIGLRKNARSLEHRARALFAAQEYLELVTSALPTTGPAAWQTNVLEDNQVIKGTLDVRPCQKVPTLRQVTLTVVWTDPQGGPQHRLVLSRLVPNQVTP